MRTTARLVELGADDSDLRRALYTSDASLYRVVPTAVATPTDTQILAALVQAALADRLPITVRGAGTSCAGNAVGPGLVIDTSKHLHRILDLDPDTRTARVEPGVVPARLNRAAAAHGLRFGPDPSTSDRCTVGGMIGNNACGPRALGYGRTSDNVVALDVITGTGEQLTVDRRLGRSGVSSPLIDALERLVRKNLGVIRTEFGRFPRQLSGYPLDYLLPERGFDVTGFLVGTEGNLAVVTEATLNLVADEPERTLVILGFPSMAEAADRVEDVLSFRPTACEGLDRRIVEVASRRGSVTGDLPDGDAWLFIELAGQDAAEVAARAMALVAELKVPARVVNDQALAQRWWRIRSDGAGYAAIALDRPAHAGWEDAAVPPARLGGYLRDFETLLSDHGLHALPYGHFGDGCVHCRIDFPLDQPGGRDALRRFLGDAAELVGRHGGSMTGEHGDGRARSDLLPAMYSPAALRLFAEVKRLFDPNNLLNPGIIVDPASAVSDLRIPQLGRPLIGLAAETHRCTGVGRCLVTEGSGVMCPSFRATGDEKDSTRGRARVLQELANGRLLTGGAATPAVQDALDLCLSCKACASECPTGVDLATYKSEILDETYRGRLRPRTHYSLGWLPTWGRMISAVPGLAAAVNGLLRAPILGPAARAVAGIDRRRRLPLFRTGRLPAPARPASGKPVAVWIDSSTDAFENQHLDALFRLLAAAGYAPEAIPATACCGLPWISTGQLDHARRELARGLEVLGPVAASGTPIVGVEPSCVATWRSDALRLLEDERAPVVAAAIITPAELLAATPDWQPPDLSGLTVVVQPHCHHRAVMGWTADAALLARTGADVVTVPGCCGLAGNFGMEPPHYEVANAIAALDLLPAIAAAGPDAILLADGLSCRTQITDLTGRQVLTLPELLLGELAIR